MVTVTRATFVLIAALSILSSAAFADEYHYNNVLIGDRASGMGGAYTAISDDATGMFYNPAAIVYVGDKNVSASVNAYFSQYKKYENVIGSQPFERTSSALLANYFGIVKSVEGYKIGFSYAVPDAVNEDQNQTFTNVTANTSRYTVNLNNRDNTYNFGPSFATEISSSLALGMTLYAHQRDAQQSSNYYVERTTGTNQWSNQYFRLHETGVKPILGLSWAAGEKISMGFALSKTFVLSSSATNQSTCWDAVAQGCANTGKTAPSILAPSLTSYDVKRTYPTKLAVGMAYFASRSLLFSGDLTYHTAVNDPLYGNKVETVNAALGTEYYLSKRWAIRAGLYTNRANTPDIQAGVTAIEEKIDLYGASMSISNFTGSTSVTLGASVNYGRGLSQITGDTSVQNASTSGWLLFLSSSY